MRTNKQVYEEVIEPLLKDMFEICKENNIQMFSGFIFDKNEIASNRITHCTISNVKEEDKLEMLEMLEMINHVINKGPFN